MPKLNEEGRAAVSKLLRKAFRGLHPGTDDAELIRKGLIKIQTEMKGLKATDADIARKMALRAKAQSIVNDAVQVAVKKQAKLDANNLKRTAIKSSFEKVVSSSKSSVVKDMKLAHKVDIKRESIVADLLDHIDDEGVIKISDDAADSEFLGLVAKEAQSYIDRAKQNVREEMHSSFGGDVLSRTASLDDHMLLRKNYRMLHGVEELAVEGKKYKGSTAAAKVIHTPKDTVAAVYAMIKSGAGDNMKAETDALKTAHRLLERAPYIENLTEFHVNQLDSAINILHNKSGKSVGESSFITEYLHRAFRPAEGAKISESVTVQMLKEGVDENALAEAARITGIQAGDVDRSSLRDVFAHFAEGALLETAITNVDDAVLHDIGTKVGVDLWSIPERKDKMLTALAESGDRVPALVDETIQAEIAKAYEKQSFDAVSEKEVNEWLLNNGDKLPRVKPAELLEKSKMNIISRQHDAFHANVDSVISSIVHKKSDEVVMLTSALESYSHAYRLTGVKSRTLGLINNRLTQAFMSVTLSLMLSSPRLAFTNSGQLLATVGFNPASLLGKGALGRYFAVPAGITSGVYKGTILRAVKLGKEVKAAVSRAKIQVRKNPYANLAADIVDDNAFLRMLDSEQPTIVKAVRERYFKSVNPSVLENMAKRHTAMGYDQVRNAGIVEGVYMEKTGVLNSINKASGKVADWTLDPAVKIVSEVVTTGYVTSDIVAREIAVEVFSRKIAQDMHSSLTELVHESVPMLGDARYTMIAKANFMGKMEKKLHLHRLDNIQADRIRTLLEGAVSGSTKIESAMAVEAIHEYVNAMIDASLFTYHRSNVPAGIAAVKANDYISSSAIFQNWPFYAANTYGKAMRGGKANFGLGAIDHYKKNRSMYLHDFEEVKSRLMAKGLTDEAAAIQLVNTVSKEDVAKLRQDYEIAADNQMIERAAYTASRQHYRGESRRAAGKLLLGALASTMLMSYGYDGLEHLYQESGLAEAVDSIMGADPDSKEYKRLLEDAVLRNDVISTVFGVKTKHEANNFVYGLKKAAIFNMMFTATGYSEEGWKPFDMLLRTHPMGPAIEGSIEAGKNALGGKDVEWLQEIKDGYSKTPLVKTGAKIYDNLFGD